MLMRGLPTVVALGVALAGFVLWRTTNSRPARWVVALHAVYGGVAFAYAALTALPLRDALAGRGLFAALPYVLQSVFIGGFVVLPLGLTVAVVRAGIPRFREESPRRTIYQAVALALAFGLVLTSIPNVAHSGTLPTRSSRSPAERVAALDKSLQTVEHGEREAPRDRWDPDYVVRALGRDPHRLFAWVRENTFWIPYHGVLRGPVGMLMDRQGNSLDRAMLLAVLLEKAGHAVRLAHAELTRERAMDALPVLLAHRLAAFQAEQPRPAGSAADVSGNAASHGLDPQRVAHLVRVQDDAVTHALNELDVRVADQTSRLLPSVVRSADAESEWRTRFDRAIGALRDHWWVQREAGEKWEDLDLLDGIPAKGIPTLVAAETLSPSGIPDALRHEVVVRVQSEQWSDGALSQRTLLEYALQPSDLIGQPIVLQFWPLDWIADSGIQAPSRAEFRRSVANERAWLGVLLVGRNLVARTGFLDNGHDLDTPVKGGPFGGIANAFAKSMGVSAAERVLSAVTIEYEIRVPGEKPRIERRSIFDLIGPAARAASRKPALMLTESAKLKRALALTMRTEILPIVCRLAPEFVTHLAAQSVLGGRDLFAAAAKDALPNGSPATESLFDHAPPSSTSPLYALALTRTEWSRDAATIFIDQPNVITSHADVVADGDRVARRDATDIVFNDIAVSLTVRDAFPIRLGQGVLDTNAESLVQIASSVTGNVGDAFAATRNWIAIAPDHADAVEKLNASDDDRRRIRDDLGSGKTVIALEGGRQAGSERFAGWWRIDSRTGSALGIGENGWGQSMVERAFQDIWARIQATPLIVYIQNFNVGFYSSYVWCISVGFPPEKTPQMTLPEVVAALGDADRCAPNAFIWGLASAVVPLVIMSVRFLLAARFPRLAPPLRPPPVRPASSQGPNGAGGEPGGAPAGNPKSNPSTSPNAPRPNAPTTEAPPPTEAPPEEPPPPKDPPPCDEGGGAPSEPAVPDENVPTAPRGPDPNGREPMSPEQSKQWVDSQKSQVSLEEARYSAAQERYLQAEKADQVAETKAKEAKAYYESTKANNADQATQQKAWEDSNAAGRDQNETSKQVTQALKDLDWASKSLSISKQAEATAERVKAANDVWWQKQQEMENAYTEFDNWVKSHPEASSNMYDTPEWQRYLDTTRQAEAARRAANNASWGGSTGCGGVAEASTQPAVVDPAQDVTVAAGMAATADAMVVK